tara:strand:+ start:1072 stop:2925 length:1854 start_codon:yes stop_codon:yes gene_type:complete
MCGISGICGDNWESNQLYAMTKIQEHRGPDNKGHFINTNHKIGLGHNRLSIIDLSDSANCPMTDTSGGVTVVFNGEIYNYLELRDQLTYYPFQTTGDTEVILAAYIRWGERCVQKFIGMFSFAIWDESKNQLFCSRDRLGIKPFFFHTQENTFYFASDAKALFAAGVPVKPDWKQWTTYLTKGYYDHSRDTFFEGVKTLPGGHNLVYKNNQVHITPYWKMEDSPKGSSSRSINDYSEELQSLVSESLNLHMRSDVPVNVNLSGGIDSGILATILDTSNYSVPITSFTSSFDDINYDESHMIPDLGLTNFVNMKHVTNASSIPSLAEELLWHQEAPYGGIPTLAYYDLHKFMQTSSTKVSLEGQGFDELFGGYKYVQPYHYADIVVEQGWNGLEQQISPKYLSPTVKTQIKSILDYNAVPVNQDSTEHLKTNCLSHNILHFDDEFAGFDRPFSRFLDNILYQDLMHTKLPRVLRMNDKLSMATGIELRVPFLDHRLVEFAFTLPNHLKIRNGQGKFILREMSRAYLPKSLITQNKISVVTPQTLWLKTELKAWVSDIINSTSFKTREIFDNHAIQSAYAQFIDTDQNNSFFVWQWLNTELWFQKFIDNNSFSKNTKAI